MTIATRTELRWFKGVDICAVHFRFCWQRPKTKNVLVRLKTLWVPRPH